MNKDEFIIRLKESDTLKLTKDDIDTILADYSSNPDEIFDCNLSCKNKGFSFDLSILGAIIFFLEIEQDLISNPIFLSAIKNPESLDRPAESHSDEYKLTPLGSAILNYKTEIVDKLLEKNPELLDQPAQIFTNGVKQTPLGFAIWHFNTKIVDKLLEKYPQLLDKPAEISADGSKKTPLVIAMELDEDLDNIIVDKILEKNPELLDQPAQIFTNGASLMPLGFAILHYKTEIVDKLLEKNPELLDKPAQSFADGTTLTPLGVAILNYNAEIVDKLLEKNPELLDKTAQSFANGTKKTPLGFITQLSEVCYKSEITDLLLDYGAHEENLENSRNKLNDLQKIQLEKNKQTKLVYEGKTSTIKEVGDLNQKYFRNLCKQFGAPPLQDQTFKDYIQNHILTSDQTKDNDIGIHVAEILYCLKKNIFKAVSPYSQLKKLQQPGAEFSSEINRDEDSIATISAYEEKEGRFKPENIFKFEENLKDYLNFFLRKPEIAKLILESSQNWILSEQEHKNREQLSRQFFENHKSLNFSIISEQQEQISEQQEQISEQQEQISELQKQISLQQEQISAQQQEILTLRTETAEQREERQFQEDLQKSANAISKTKITSYFKLENDQSLGKRPSSEMSPHSDDDSFASNPSKSQKK